MYLYVDTQTHTHTHTQIIGPCWLVLYMSVDECIAGLFVFVFV